jgi:hypothetical protein
VRTSEVGKDHVERKIPKIAHVELNRDAPPKPVSGEDRKRLRCASERVPTKRKKETTGTREKKYLLPLPREVSQLSTV